jgi:hypothetical protein
VIVVRVLAVTSFALLLVALPGLARAMRQEFTWRRRERQFDRDHGGRLA